METPKTKTEQICEYHAAHPEATCKQSERDKANYQRDKKAYYEKKRKYQIAHREEIKAYKRRYYAEKHPKKRAVELHPWAKPVTLAAVEPVETPQKVRPIPAEARRFLRRQDALLKQMEHCTDSREAQRLMSEYSALQYRIEYKQTMANAADRHDAANHQCGVPMMFKVANGNGFSHH